MAIRGETIGTAFVRILADGSGLDDSLKREMRKSAPVMESQGEIGGESYQKGFESVTKKWKPEDVIAKAMEKGRGKFDAQGNFIAKDLFRGVKEQLEKDFGDVGLVVGKNLTEDMERGMSFDGLMSKLKNIRPEIVKATEQIGKATEENLVKKAKDADEAWRRFQLRIEKADGAILKLSDSVGRLFGKGSRNDFINFFGAFSAFPLTLLGGVSNTIDKLALSAGEFVGNVAGSANKIGTFAAGIGKLGGVAALAGVSFGVMLASLGAVMSAVSLLGGIVTALASSLSFALVGALGVAAGAMVPLVAAIGVAILAFKNMDAEQKKAFKGVGTAFKDLGSSAADSMFDAMGDSASNLTGIIKQLEPVVDGVAAAMGGVFLSWTEGLQSAGTSKFLRTLSKTLPDMVTSLGAIFGNMGEAMAGIWTAATPFVQEFLGWLTGVTDQFGKFSTSFKGQEKITTFFTHMRSSLINVSGFLEEVIGLVGDLLGAGRRSGDSIFISMTEAVEGWRDALAKDPEILSRWFADAEDFADVLGQLVDGFGALFDALDSEAFRTLATTLTGVVASALSNTASLLTPLIQLIGTLDGDMLGFITTVLLAAGAWQKLNTFTQAAKLKFDAVSTSLTDTDTRAATLKGTIRNLSGAAGLGLLAMGAQESNDKLGLLETTLGGAATGFAVGGPWGALIGGAAGAMFKLATNTDKTKESQKQAAPVAEDYAGTLDQITGAATQATSEMIRMDLQQQGALTAANNLGISSRDLIKAMEGQPGALRSVRKAMKEAKDETISYIDPQSGVMVTTGKFAGSLGKLETALGLVSPEIKDATKNVRDMAADTAPLEELLANWPKKKVTRLENEKVPQTKRELETLAEKYKLTPKQLKTFVDVLNVPVSKRQVNDIIELLDTADKKDPKSDITITSNAPSVTTDLNALDTALNNIPGTKDIDIRVETIKSTRTVPAKKAAGGILSGPTHIIAGEAGPEAIVPLNRPLSRVDPAVRELSAIAQGLRPMANGGVAVPKMAVGDINVYTNVVDPRAVASEVLNRLVATGY